MDSDQIKTMLKQSTNIVFFGGAGTSTESGIPDFRSSGGLYNTKSERNSPEQILSHDFFMNHAEEFYEFYKKNLVHEHAAPNTAHHALATMENEGRLRAVITQNIDGLHQKAGSQNVIELHGSIHRNHCMGCNAFFTLDEMMKINTLIPACDRCGGIIKPEVTLYQEKLNDDVLNQAVSYVADADILIVAGTSLTVYPAAGLIRYYRNDKLILINKSTTPYDGVADYIIQGSVGNVLSSFLG